MLQEACNLLVLLHDGDDDEYIDIEIVSNSSQLSSSPHVHRPNTEFEFQRLCCSNTALQTLHSSTTTTMMTSPADELFYRGKLLPLQHLRPPPPIQNASSQKELFSTPLETPTPYQSCTVSPSESRRVSTDQLNPQNYDHHFKKQLDHLQCNLKGLSNNHKSFSKKSSWISKIKQSSIIGSKIKASTAYLKSLFAKSQQHNINVIQQQKQQETKLDKHQPPPVLVANYSKPKIKQFQKRELSSSSSCNNFLRPSASEDNENRGQHRRSFSVVSIKKPVSSSNIKIPWTSDSSVSTYSSTKNNGNGELLKRSSSVSLSGIESPIQAAIAHCKKSSQHDIILTPNINHYSSITNTNITNLCEAAAATAGHISISAAARISISREDHPNLLGIITREGESRAE